MLWGVVVGQMNVTEEGRIPDTALIRLIPMLASAYKLISSLLK